MEPGTVGAAALKLNGAKLTRGGKTRRQRQPGDDGKASGKTRGDAPGAEKAPHARSALANAGM